MMRGAHNNAGEIGHLVLDASGPVCSCGRRGDVESYARGVSLLRRAAHRWPAGVLDDGTAAARSVADVFSLAAAKNPDASGPVADATSALASAVAGFSLHVPSIKRAAFFRATTRTVHFRAPPGQGRGASDDRHHQDKVVFRKQGLASLDH
jgi:hypothetical protein